MPNTATYTVHNPVPGTKYYAPSGDWAVPNSGSTVTCTVQTFDSGGAAQVVSSLTAIISDATTSTDKSSFTFAGGDQVQAASANGTNGRDAFRAGGMVGSACATLTMFLTYSGHAFDQPPNAPTNLTPSANALSTTLTPAFGAKFTTPTSGDTLNQYEIQVYNGSNGSGSLVFDTGNVTAGPGQRSAAALNYTYNGPALHFGSTYSWRCRMSNQNNLWSGWSTFATWLEIVGPSIPTGILPNGTVSSLTPSWSFTYHSNGGTSMAHHHWWITSASGGATVYDNGSVAAVLADGATLAGTIPGGANLQNGQSYIFNIVAINSGGASSPTGTSAFSIPQAPVATPTSPINNVTASSTTPTFRWSFTDPNGYTQASFRVTIYNAQTNALIKDTGVVSSAANSYTLSGTTIAFGTYIAWAVQVVDSIGVSGPTSALAYAYVNNLPFGTISSPASGASIVTNTPTITWTYTPASGGFAQASASLALKDSNGNVLATFAVSGTGTSVTLPAGLLTNNTSYQLQVTATDTNGATGVGAVSTFTLSYAAPADMQGQPLTSAKNWIKSPYLNTDGGSGVAVDWTSATSPGITGSYAIDDSVSQQVQLANGDGAVIGAQMLQITAATLVGSVAILQSIAISVPGWTTGTLLSLTGTAIVQQSAGSALYARLQMRFFDVHGTIIGSTFSGGQIFDTAGAQVQSTGLQGIAIPAGTVTVQTLVRMFNTTTADTGTVWWMDMQLEAASTNDPNFIAGDLGTGYDFDANGYSERNLLAGNQPTLSANPGTDTDPASGSGGSITVSWDTTLADSRFIYYLIERREQNDNDDDTAWLTVATINDDTVGLYTDYSAGSTIVYQYSIRQVITFTDGSTGISAHRAIVVGQCNFSPAWYVVNSTGTQIFNVRLTAVSPKRKFAWKENAQYSAFLGRPGSARDAGQPLGYDITLDCYFNQVFGDDLDDVRQTFITMQTLGLVWLVKSPSGRVIPSFMTDIDFDEDENDSDELLTVTLHFRQAQKTTDY